MECGSLLSHSIMGMTIKSTFEDIPKSTFLLPSYDEGYLAEVVSALWILNVGNPLSVPVQAL